MTLWLPEATTTAPEVDYLILALLLISCAPSSRSSSA